MANNGEDAMPGRLKKPGFVQTGEHDHRVDTRHNR